MSRRSAAKPRKPQRENGRKKYEKLLDTLEALLQRKEASDITLADLSEAAGVPTASVYHFFPNRDACVAALAERYFNGCKELLEVTPAPEEWHSWQELVSLFCERTRAYFAANEPLQKVKFGPKASWAVRELAVENSHHLAQTLHAAFAQAFELPPSPAWESRFLQAVTISESLWSLSYARFGHITEDDAAEARRAATAYLGLHLGERLERRGL
ncbi:TetR/AcrR family transcriptional regulator [Microbulbifer sp. SAOS-129_SWC]|uniref:TetR/AcrR family transcriptional regulator n=1 Tax=Microbulbifer sp. SAOS-129_SWC TaxID=3145235 RepID=UPI0032179627